MAGEHASEWTLTEAARLLGEPQHRLIYLCEKGVVEPDLREADGRGSSRGFSARNLLELAVALRLRDLAIPVSLAGIVLHVLRSFEGRVRAEIPGFRLPDGLMGRAAPDLRVLIADGRRLYFTLGLTGQVPKVFGGIDLGEAERSLSPATLAERFEEPIATPPGSAGSEFGRPEGSRHARVEVSVTRIAQDMRLET